MVNLESYAERACALMVIMAASFFLSSPAMCADVASPATSDADPIMSIPPSLTAPALSPLRKSAFAAPSATSVPSSGRSGETPVYVPMSSPGDHTAPKTGK